MFLWTSMGIHICDAFQVPNELICVDENGLRFLCYAPKWSTMYMRYAIVCTIYALWHEFNTHNNAMWLIKPYIQLKWFYFPSPFCSMRTAANEHLYLSKKTVVRPSHAYDYYCTRRPSVSNSSLFSFREHVILTDVLLTVCFYLFFFFCLLVCFCIHSFIYLFYFSSPFFFLHFSTTHKPPLYTIHKRCE